MLEKLRNRCWKKRLRRILKKKAGEREILPWDRVVKIGVYVDEARLPDKKALLAAVRQAGTGREWSLLVYSDNPVASKEAYGNVWKELFFLDRKSLGFSRFPKQNRAGAFFQTGYDLLIDLSPEFHYVDVAVMAMAQAKLKVGKYGDWNQKVNDLSLSLPEGKEPLGQVLAALQAYLPSLGTGGGSPEALGRKKKERPGPGRS